MRLGGWSFGERVHDAIAAAARRRILAPVRVVIRIPLGFELEGEHPDVLFRDVRSDLEENDLLDHGLSLYKGYRARAINSYRTLTIWSGERKFSRGRLIS